MKKLYSIIAIMLCACEVQVSETPKEVFEISAVPACKTRFNQGYNNQGKRWNKNPPPDDFLHELYRFISKTCHKNDVLYGVNKEPRDAFSYLSSELGVSSKSSRSHRCAAMFELVRTSAAFESDYDWQEGRDKSASNYTYYTMESGIFQTSPNSHIYAPSWKGSWGRWTYLDDLVAPYLSGKVHISREDINKEWNTLMKDESKKSLIIHHYVFMMRHNYRHYGPVIDKKNRVAPNLSKECIKQVERFL